MPTRHNPMHGKSSFAWGMSLLRYEYLNSPVNQNLTGLFTACFSITIIIPFFAVPLISCFTKQSEKDIFGRAFKELKQGDLWRREKLFRSLMISLSKTR